MSGCEKCHGTGKVVCSKCGGEKEVKCEKCNGKGTFRNCSKCDSTGKVDCSRCNGSGKEISICPVCVLGGVYNTRWINCAGCHGTGRRKETEGINRGRIVSCWECGGRGQVKETYKEICPNCHGEYERKTDKACKECAGTGKVECSRCGGTGRAKCQKCNGGGKVKCDTCSGVGEVKCPECEKREHAAKEKRDREERAEKEKKEAEQRKKLAEQRRKDEAEKAAKERKDAIQGCGCLLAIAAVIGFFIWWWMEGLTMSALPGMWEQTKNTLGGGALGTIAKIGCAVIALFIGWYLIKGIKGKKGEVSTSTKKRWKFVTIGVLLGFLGVHLAYAKRWLLFLLLWAGFITGNVTSGAKSDTDNPLPETVTQQVEPADKSNKKDSNPISAIGFGIWALLWIGGALFIKKDGKGNRM